MGDWVGKICSDVGRRYFLGDPKAMFSLLIARNKTSYS